MAGLSNPTNNEELEDILALVEDVRSFALLKKEVKAIVVELAFNGSPPAECDDWSPAQYLDYYLHSPAIDEAVRLESLQRLRNALYHPSPDGEQPAVLNNADDSGGSEVALNLIDEEEEGGSEPLLNVEDDYEPYPEDVYYESDLDLGSEEAYLRDAHDLANLDDDDDDGYEPDLDNDDEYELLLNNNDLYEYEHALQHIDDGYEPDIDEADEVPRPQYSTEVLHKVSMTSQSNSSGASELSLLSRSSIDLYSNPSCYFEGPTALLDEDAMEDVRRRISNLRRGSSSRLPTETNDIYVFPPASSDDDDAVNTMYFSPGSEFDDESPTIIRSPVSPEVVFLKEAESGALADTSSTGVMLMPIHEVSSSKLAGVDSASLNARLQALLVPSPKPKAKVSKKPAVNIIERNRQAVSRTQDKDNKNSTGYVPYSVKYTYKPKAFEASQAPKPKYDYKLRNYPRPWAEPPPISARRALSLASITVQNRLTPCQSITSVETLPSINSSRDFELFTLQRYLDDDMFDQYLVPKETHEVLNRVLGIPMADEEMSRLRSQCQSGTKTKARTTSALKDRNTMDPACHQPKFLLPSEKRIMTKLGTTCQNFDYNTKTTKATALNTKAQQSTSKAVAANPRVQKSTSKSVTTGNPRVQKSTSKSISSNPKAQMSTSKPIASNPKPFNSTSNPKAQKSNSKAITFTLVTKPPENQNSKSKSITMNPKAANSKSKLITMNPKAQNSSSKPVQNQTQIKTGGPLKFFKYVKTKPQSSKLAPLNNNSSKTQRPMKPQAPEWPKLVLDRSVFMQAEDLVKKAKKALATNPIIHGPPPAIFLKPPPKPTVAASISKKSEDNFYHHQQDRKR